MLNIEISNNTYDSNLRGNTNNIYSNTPNFSKSSKPNIYNNLDRNSNNYNRLDFGKGQNNTYDRNYNTLDKNTMEDDNLYDEATEFKSSRTSSFVYYPPTNNSYESRRVLKNDTYGYTSDPYEI